MLPVNHSKDVQIPSADKITEGFSPKVNRNNMLPKRKLKHGMSMMDNKLKFRLNESKSPWSPKSTNKILSDTDDNQGERDHQVKLFIGIEDIQEA